jgi:small subunit ribosomal protein S3
MGQKINPIGFRLAVNKNWTSRWYANKKNFAPMLAEDIKVRDFLKGKLAHASVGRVLIERPAKDARITIFSARPGVVIGKKGEEIEALKAALRRIMGVQQVHVNIEEIRKPEIDAQLIADSIAQQLEKRIMFRRAMKRAMQNAMRLGAQGIKIMSAGRLNGIEIARTEWYREGRVPLHTLRSPRRRRSPSAPRNRSPASRAPSVGRRSRAPMAKRSQRRRKPKPRPLPRRSSRSRRRSSRTRAAAGNPRNRPCCNLHEPSTASSRRAATPATPSAAPRCRSASTA